MTDLKNKTLPDYMTKFAHTNSFGTIDKNGSVTLSDADCKEIELLAGISAVEGRYVFKRRCGQFGYLDENQIFVPIA